MIVTPSGQACGATVRGVDLREELPTDTVAAIRRHWLEHRVLSFPDQPLTDDDLERFTLYFGPFGHDPYFEPIDGRTNIAAVHRSADEQAPVFAEVWHADWSFQQHPPDGTCLHSRIIPPEGGDTFFADQVAALAAMPDELRERIADVVAVHSARGGYAPDGAYGEGDGERAMRIVYDESAYATQTHPLVQHHAETGEPTLYSTHGYIIDLIGVDDATELLREVSRWQTTEAVQYRHRWEPDMLVMWDNRCVLHKASGGYDGHERLLHRTTIGHAGGVRQPG